MFVNWQIRFSLAEDYIASLSLFVQLLLEYKSILCWKVNFQNGFTALA